MYNTLKWAVLLCLMFAVKGAWAEPLSATSNLGIALESMANTKGFSADFEQVLSYAEGGERKYEGQLYILRPGKFRWHYIKPYEQLYVSNGDGIWLYEPDLLQAQRLQDLGDVDPIVLQLLDGRVSLDDVEVLQQESFGELFSSWHIRIGKMNNQIEVWLGVKDKTLVWIESRDMLSNRNRLNLLNLDFTAPSADIFEFTAPEGVDVIGAIE